MNKKILPCITLLLWGSLSWAGPPGQGARTAGTDSLPWGGGRVVFGPWVRVDNAPGTTGHPANHPQMVMDFNHAMYSVWQDDRSNTGRYQIYFSKSTDLGSTWSLNRMLSAGLPNLNHLYPWIAVDTYKLGFSTLFVVWQVQQGNQWKVYFTRSTDLGATWTAADTVHGVSVRNSTTSNINSGPQPKIAVDGSSMVTTYLYLAWVDDGTGTLRINFARSLNLGASFENQILLDHNSGNINREPDLALSDSGVVHAVWRWGTGGSNQDPHPWIGYNKSTDHGVSFQAQDLIVLDDTTSQVYRGNPTVTVNSRNQNVLVSWEDSRVRSGNNGPDIFFARSTNGGAGFGPNTRANLFSPDPTTENRKPAISIDPGGIAVVAWHDNYNSTRFGIHMAAYNDTTNVFGAPPSSLFNTYTENNGGAFGTNLYPPSLKVVTIDTVPNFFLVWQDLSEDPAGNIYFVRGWVENADLDIYNDALDVHGNLMDFGKVAAGPPRQVKSFQLVNTDASHNPDPDGPSMDTLLTNVRPVSVTLVSPNNPSFDAWVSVPLTLRQGQIQTGTVTLRVPDPDNQPPGVYQGPIVIQGAGRDTFDVASDTFNVRVEVGNPLNLRQFKIMPNPFKSKEGHTKIYFYGLPAGCKVRIYDLSGTAVKELQNTLNNGTVAWDPMRDPDVASGIYFYYLTYGQKDIQKGKLSVIK